MDKEIMRKWIEALRSGEYAQCQNSLMDDKGYCCLGVLAAIQGAPVRDMAQDSIELVHGGQDYNAGLGEDARKILADMNDGRAALRPRSFDHIAGYVQAMFLS